MYTRHIDTQYDTDRLHNRPVLHGSALEAVQPGRPDVARSDAVYPIEITWFNMDDHPAFVADETGLALRIGARKGLPGARSPDGTPRLYRFYGRMFYFLCMCFCFSFFFFFGGFELAGNVALCLEALAGEKILL